MSSFMPVLKTTLYKLLATVLFTIQNANNRELTAVNLIVSKRCLNRIYINLINFTS
jgi:hypothetical protein